VASVQQTQRHPAVLAISIIIIMAVLLYRKVLGVWV